MGYITVSHSGWAPTIKHAALRLEKYLQTRRARGPSKRLSAFRGEAQRRGYAFTDVSNSMPPAEKSAALNQHD